MLTALDALNAIPTDRIERLPIVRDVVSENLTDSKGILTLYLSDGTEITYTVEVDTSKAKDVPESVSSNESEDVAEPLDFDRDVASRR